MTYRDERDEIYYTPVETEFGNGAALFYVRDGAAVTRLAETVWPMDQQGVSGQQSARYERPDGVVIPLSDALRLGMQRG